MQGRLTLLMGPPGGGKSTLLQLLAGLLVGRSVQVIKHLSKVSCVSQFIHLHACLLMFSLSFTYSFAHACVLLITFRHTCCWLPSPRNCCAAIICCCKVNGFAFSSPSQVAVSAVDQLDLLQPTTPSCHCHMLNEANSMLFSATLGTALSYYLIIIG